MKFFIPLAEDKEKELRVYKSIKEFLQNEIGAEFSNRKVFSLRYKHDGNEYYAEVGQPHALNGEPVFAILFEELRNAYHVCTINRGVARGIPILVGVHDVKSVVDFEP